MITRVMAGGYRAVRHPRGTWLVTSPTGESVTKRSVFEAIAWIVSGVNRTS